MKRSCCSFVVPSKQHGKMKKKKQEITQWKSTHWRFAVWERMKENGLFKCSMWLMVYGNMDHHTHTQYDYVNTVVGFCWNRMLHWHPWPHIRTAHRMSALFALDRPRANHLPIQRPNFIGCRYTARSTARFAYLIFNSFVNIYVEMYSSMFEIIDFSLLFSRSSSFWSMHIVVV